MKLGHGCPAPELLGRFYLKETDDSEWDQVVGHLSQCTPCRRSLVLLAESEADGGRDEARGKGPRIGAYPPHPLLKVSAAVLLIATATWPWRIPEPELVQAEYIPARSPVSSLDFGRPAPPNRVAPSVVEGDALPPDSLGEMPSLSDPEDGLSSPGGSPLLGSAGASGLSKPPPASSGPPAAAPEEPEPAPNPSWPKTLAHLQQEEPPPRPGPEPPIRPQYESPHSDFEEALERHFSPGAWKEYVWDDYMTRPEILLPVCLALSAAAVSHWDRPLERHWEGGEHASASRVGEIGLMAAAGVIGVLFPGEGRNGWDEAWTVGETLGIAALTSYALKSGARRSHATESPEREEHGLGFGSRSSTNAFAASELLERNSGPAVGLPSFGIALFTAFADMHGGRRYPSDVLAGAALGTLSAGIFDSLHWGTGTVGGIARPSMQVALDTDALKECQLTVTFVF